MTDAWSLRRQLLAWLLVPLLGWSLAGSVLAYLLAAHFATAAYDRVLYGAILDLAKQIRAGDAGLQLDLPPAAREMFEWNEADRVYYRIALEDGRVVSGEAQLPAPPKALRPGHAQFYDGTHAGSPVRVAALWTTLSGLPGQPRLVIQVAETLDARQDIARQILLATLLPESLLALLAAGALWVGVSHGLAPLARLREEIARRSDQDLSPIPEQRAPAEVRPLAHAVNALLSRLEVALTAQRRFVANAAHQLRTPLAGIRTQAEIALRQSDPEELAHTLAQLRSGTERTTHLLNQLLSLARLEPGDARAHPQVEMDLSEAARATTALWVPQALRRGIDLGFEGAGVDLTVAGDRLLLEELLGNLIENALVHGPGTTRVTVAAAALGGAPVLSVEDDGPGVPPGERSRLFERFERGRTSGQVRGSGLGLAIVREIATLHAARVSMGQGAQGRGTRVEVVFPGRPTIG